MALAQHSAETGNWGSPAWIPDLARRVLGGKIHVDLCSDAYWNEHAVRAERFIDAEEDALDPESDDIETGSSVYCNAFGGLVREFFDLCVRLWKIHHPVFWTGFSVEQLSYLQSRGLFHAGFRRAILPKRVAYLQTPEAARVRLNLAAKKLERASKFKAAKKLRAKANAIDLAGGPLPGPAPTHSSYLLLMPTKDGQVERFDAEMRERGAEVW
jgi:hypothetical protein